MFSPKMRTPLSAYLLSHPICLSLSPDQGLLQGFGDLTHSARIRVGQNAEHFRCVNHPAHLGFNPRKRPASPEPPGLATVERESLREKASGPDHNHH